MHLTTSTEYDRVHGQKLTPHQRASIAILVAHDGELQRYVAELFGVHQSTISRIARGAWHNGYSVRGVTA